MEEQSVLFWDRAAAIKKHIYTNLQMFTEPIPSVVTWCPLRHLGYFSE